MDGLFGGSAGLVRSLTQARRVGPPALIGLLIAVALALGVPVLRAGGEVVAEPRISLLVLLAVWTMFELVTLFLPFGKEVDNADEVILTEIPLALALLFCTPADLFLVGVGVPVLIDAARRIRSPLKQVFNTANRAVEISLALSVYHAFAPPEPFSLYGWIVLAFAAMASAVASGIAVSSVISLAAGHWPGRDFLGHVTLAVPVSLTGATLAFVAGLSLQSGDVAVAPLAASAVALLMLVRLFSGLTDRHLNLASLHRLGERLASTRDVDSIVAAALETSSEMLVAPDAVAYLQDSPDDPTLLRVDTAPDGTLVRTQVGRGSVPQTRGLEPDRRTAVASASLAPGQELVLSVARRKGRSRPFRRQDSRLLHMIARQAGADLHTAQLIDRLRHDALYDSLTDLPNRRFLLESLDERLSDGLPVQVLWLGVQELQVVNGALGYDYGDELLVQIGRRLQAVAGPDRVVARVAGDEFAVLMPAGADEGSDRETVSALLGTLARPFPLAGVEVVARASAGIAVAIDEPDALAQDLLRRADLAMRLARRTGRTLERYAPHLETASSERLRLVADLQAGIRRGELVLHGQPQVRLSDGGLVGVEMLVRWNHPQLGLLDPASFVPLAEQTGLDGPLTAWVLNASLKTLAGWRAAGLQLTVSVNVPASALADDVLRDLTDELLTLRDVPGEDLVVEITESSLVTSTAAAGRVLQGLAALGVRVSIDDFGTGFSSLSRLRRLPVDEIKVDRSFVRTMLHDDDDGAIVRSVVDLAGALGLTCVAEGVEDAQTYAALQQLGCDVAQGFFIAAPMPLDELTAWMANAQAVPRGSGALARE